MSKSDIVVHVKKSTFYQVYYCTRFLTFNSDAEICFIISSAFVFKMDA